MSKTVIFGSIIIFLIVFWLIGFINSLNEEVDVSYGFKEKSVIAEGENHTIINSNGDEVLLLSGLTKKDKKQTWNHSNLKLEMLQLFPNFAKMKLLIEKHCEDDGIFKSKILSKLEEVEFEYVGGRLTGEGAKERLINF